jgi:hypothetical protein
MRPIIRANDSNWPWRNRLAIRNATHPSVGEGVIPYPSAPFSPSSDSSRHHGGPQARSSQWARTCTGGNVRAPHRRRAAASEKASQ